MEPVCPACGNIQYWEKFINNKTILICSGEENCGYWEYKVDKVVDENE